jgi:hypothetical protein
MPFFNQLLIEVERFVLFSDRLLAGTPNFLTNMIAGQAK